jgi:hypothetical protein
LTWNDGGQAASEQRDSNKRQEQLAPHAREPA